MFGITGKMQKGKEGMLASMIFSFFGGKEATLAALSDKVSSAEPDLIRLLEENGIAEGYDFATLTLQVAKHKEQSRIIVYRSSSRITEEGKIETLKPEKSKLFKQFLLEIITMVLDASNADPKEPKSLPPNLDQKA